MTGPESMSVKFNESTSLQCTTVPYGLTVEWYTGSIFTNLTSIDDMTNEHYYVDDEANLKVTEFHNRHHEGDYTCHVSYSSMQQLYSCPGTLSQASKSNIKMCCSIIIIHESLHIDNRIIS